MLTDEQLIDLVISEPSWEDVIVKIVAEEAMDPWAVDIIRLTEVFIVYLKKMEELDLRIPARFILIASILLRMKSDVLVEKEEKILIPDSEKEPNETLRILAKLPSLKAPIKRMPVKNVSINELLTALKKAYEVKERRIERKRRVKRIVAFAIPLTEQENIAQKIEKLLADINEALVEVDNIEFSRLVKKWGRKEIVESLIPLLHLSQDGKIDLTQKELFKEIVVRLKE